jgi:hypothetical protein
LEESKEAWFTDQLLKSRIFHRKLHEWGLIEIANDIEQIKGETYDWKIEELGISEEAWNKIVHRGIKPVRVFAHLRILLEKPKRVSYYRTLSMVSQKSMSKVGLPIVNYEAGKKRLNSKRALEIARHLNKIISELIIRDEVVNPREFDLWRGMAAGTQAQGSWQNEKGSEAARMINEIIRKRILEVKLGRFRDKEGRECLLNDERKLIFGSEPDIGVYDISDKILIAIEVKGGIDTAGVLERLGAALKSLSRAKRENPTSRTILILPEIAMTSTFLKEVEKSKEVDYYFAHDELINNPEKQKEFFKLLGL